MKLRAHCLVGAATVVAVLAAVTAGTAETWTLELKRIESQRRAGPDYALRMTYPQSFFVQLGSQGKKIVRMENQEQAAVFKRIVKKEPKYQSEFPLRAVAKLGSQEFAFALDSAAPTPPKEEKEKTDAEKAKTDDKQPKEDSLLGRLANRLFAAKAPAETPSLGAIAYGRLYFDFNHNGDLTDDKVIEAENDQAERRMAVARQSYLQIRFPRIDVTIDADGTALDYAFFLQGQVMVSPDFSYASISINSAACREGDITLEGKKRHVILVDFNSNGRFDDQMKMRKDVHTPDKRLFPEQGDMLLIDPSSSGPGFDSPYDITAGKYRHYVSKLVNIDDRFYDLKISPAGDKLTLELSSIPLGSVTNPNDHFRAVIYGDQGFLKISGDKGGPVPVPEGEWKLLQYTLDMTAVKQPSEPAEKKESAKTGSLLETLSKTMESMLAGSARPGSRRGPSSVTAQGTADYKAVKVGKGETVALPFGPPYKPVVKTEYFQEAGQGKQLSLGMSLFGSAGEVCTNLIVDGGQPPKPKFTITNAKGEVVQQGNFEYG
jgi:hypothetical protein